MATPGGAEADPMVAAEFYRKNAVDYKRGRCWSYAAESFSKAADNFEKASKVCHAIKALRQASVAHAMLKNDRAEIDVLVRIRNLERSEGRFSAVAKTLMTLSQKHASLHNDVDAAQCALEAADAFEAERQQFNATRSLRAAVNHWVAVERYEDAGAALRRALGLSTDSNQLALPGILFQWVLCCLLLDQGDRIALEYHYSSTQSRFPDCDFEPGRAFLVTWFETPGTLLATTQLPHHTDVAAALWRAIVAKAKPAPADGTLLE